MTPSRQAHIIRLVTALTGENTMTYDRTRVAFELEGIAEAAAQLEIRRAKIFRFAEPHTRARLQDQDAIDIELIDLVLAARKFAAVLRSEVTEQFFGDAAS